MINAALVQPPVFWTTTPPLGTTYLAGELRAAGDRVTLFDFNVELFAADPAAYGAVRRLADQVDHASPIRRLSPGELFAALARGWPADWTTLQRLTDVWVSRILETRPDMVGFSLHEQSIVPALFIADGIRRMVGPDAAPRIMAGGPEAIFLQRDPRPIASGLFDAVVVGEGEGPLREWRRRVAAGDVDVARGGFGDRSLPGAILRTASGEIVDDTAASALVDIHEIALPSFDGLPLDRYSFSRTFPILGSRGCPAKCTFCFETVMWTRFRLRHVASVVAEMRERLASHGGPLTFRFNDSLLNGDLAWLTGLAEAMASANLPVKWHGNARIHPSMDRRYLQRLAEAGLTGLLYGVESGSDRILRRMKKGVRAADIPRVLHDTHEAGIWTHGFFILGFPGETDAEALQTIDLLLDRLEDLDSLVFHDFALAPELAEYVDFAGRVPMDDAAAALPVGAQPGVAAIRPWLQAFLAHFLDFAHRYGHLHWHALGPVETRGLLDLYRRRWQQSPTLARARAALLVGRALLAEIHARSPAGSGGPPMPGHRLAAHTLADAISATEMIRERVIADVAERCPMRVAGPNDAGVLDIVAAALAPHDPLPAEGRLRHEDLAPEGFR
jgi:pyruvate-formate lyase-activating enzyme